MIDSKLASKLILAVPIGLWLSLSCINAVAQINPSAELERAAVAGVAYILMKTADGWRIAAFSGTTPQKVVRCEDEY
jgi:hypothetical protein